MNGHNINGSCPNCNNGTEIWQKQLWDILSSTDSRTEAEDDLVDFISNLLQERDKEWMQDIEEINQSIPKTIARRDKGLVEKIEQLIKTERWGSEHALEEVLIFIKSRE